MAKKKLTKADLEAREQALRDAQWLRELAEKKLAASNIPGPKTA